jgi:hypothetical protein
MNPHPVDPSAEFAAATARALAEGRLRRLVLSVPRRGAADLQRAHGRPVMLRGQPHLSLVFRHATRDLTRNLPAAGLGEALGALLDRPHAPMADPSIIASAPDTTAQAEAPRFAHARLETDEGGLELRISRKGRALLTRLPATATTDPAAREAATGRGASGPTVGAAATARPARNGGRAPYPSAEPADAGDATSAVEASAVSAADGPGQHDRHKPRALDPTAPWLHGLGVTDAQGRVVPAMSRKWKQIDKFLEVLDAGWRDSALAHRPAEAPPVRVMDFGAGRGYLTCAVSAWLNGRGQPSEVVGVELRQALVDQVNAVARRDSDATPGGRGPLAGLRFEQGDVGEHATGALDVMIALHACDTATDHAIHRGIAAGAQLIVCSPCCHQELRPQLRAPAPLAPLLRHGIHRGQEAEMLTDALRALLLEAHGYEARVFEFVSLEHTAKNKMILAVRRAVALPAEPVLAQIRAIKDFYGVREQCLEVLLGLGRGAAADHPPGASPRLREVDPVRKDAA